MNFSFKTLLDQIVALFQNLNLRQKIVIGVSIFVVVAFLVFLSFYKGNSKTSYAGYGVLFDNVSASDSALIIQQLEQDKVPYKLANESTILVPSKSVYKERIAVAALGIPKNSKVGFEIFDKQEFGATDFEQRIKYLRALEGELGRTIEGLQPIENAKIHIAIPKESVFVERQSFPTASVVLDVNPNLKLTNKQILGIKNLIAASVMKLNPKNVKIVNQNGVPLGEKNGAIDDELVKNQITYQKEYEAEYENKIKNVLAPIVGGREKVVANVTIDFDFSQENSTSEVYDPNSVPRSEQSIEEKREGVEPKELQGVPGAVSNIGPVQGLEKDKVVQKYTKNSATTNYEISKKVTNTTDAFATIKRVSAAVVVDGKYKPKVDKEGQNTDELIFTPLSQDEMARIDAIVKQTVGFNESRGDKVTVSNFEFKPLSNNKNTETATQAYMNTAKKYIEPLWPVIKYLIMLLVLFIFYKKVIVPFSQYMLESTEQYEEEQKDELVIEEDAEDTLEKFQKARKKVEEQLGVGDDFHEEQLRYEVLLEKIKQIANERSEEISQVLQNIIQNDTNFDVTKDG